jgi:hypothetical protein
MNYMNIVGEANVFSTRWCHDTLHKCYNRVHPQTQSARSVLLPVFFRENETIFSVIYSLTNCSPFSLRIRLTSKTSFKNWIHNKSSTASTEQSPFLTRVQKSSTSSESVTRGAHCNRQKIFSFPLQVETKTVDMSYLIVAGIEDCSVSNDRRGSNTVSEFGWLQKMATCNKKKRSLYGTRSRLGVLLSLHFCLRKEGFQTRFRRVSFCWTKSR